MVGIRAMLRVLAEHRVDFIVVGGVAAVLGGAPVHTFDLDIVYRRTADNLDRLQTALEELDAVFRDDPRRIRPHRSHLESAGHKLLATRHGELDCLGTIEENTDYDALIGDTEQYELAGFSFRALSLERLIRIKEGLRRAKDQAMLLILRATLEERRRPG